MIFKMGQAKQRGSYEERKQLAIAAKEITMMPRHHGKSNYNKLIAIALTGGLSAATVDAYPINKLRR